MNSKRYVVTTQLGDLKRTEIWSPDRPFKLGHTLPWTVFRSKEETLRLRHHAGQAWDINPDMIRRNQDIDLPALDAEGKPLEKTPKVKFRIRELETIEPPFARRGGVADLERGDWKVYHCVGHSVVKAEPMSKNFIGVFEDLRLFSINERSDTIELKIHSASATLEGLPGSRAKAAENAESREYQLTPVEFAQVSIHVRGRVWRFDRAQAGKAIPAVRLGGDIDSKRFKRSLAEASLVFLLLLLTAIIGPRKEEEKEEARVARMVIKRLPSEDALTPAKENSPARKAEGEKLADAAPAPLERPKDEEKDKKFVQTPPKESAQNPEVSTQPPKPLKVVQAPQVQTPKPMAQAKPLPRVASTATQTPAPPRESAAVQKAKKLQNSLGNMLQAGGFKSLIAGGSARGSPNAAKQGAGLLGSASGAYRGAEGSVVDNSGPTEVAVGFTDGGGGAQGETSYRTTGNNSGRSSRTAGKFLAVSTTSDGSGTTVDSGLTRSEVFDVINRHMNEVRYCYETAFLRRPDLEGKLMVNFTIGSRGSVTVSSVKVSTLPDDRLGHCVLERLGKWQFPQPKGGVNVAVTYPFIFRRL